MVTNSLQGLFDRVQDLVAAGFLSAFGGAAAYIYQTVKNDRGFKFGQFAVNAFLAFFIGNLVGSFIPLTASYRDGILMLAGFSTWPVLGLLEIYGSKFFEKYLKEKTGN